MEITIEASAVHTEPLTGGRIEATLNDVDAGSILSEIDIKDVVNHFGMAGLLDEIGRDEAISHFEIEEKE